MQSKADTAAFARRTPNKAAFGFILVSVLLDALSFGLVYPVLPRLVLELSGGNTADSSRIFGLIAGAWALMNFLAAPVLGVLSDRFGRRPVILISLFGLSLDLAIMALASNVGWLFVGRALSGVTAAKAAGISRSLFYRMLGEGNGPPLVRPFAKRTLVRVADLKAWIAKLEPATLLPAPKTGKDAA